MRANKLQDKEQTEVQVWYKNNLLYNSAELPAYWYQTTARKRQLISNWSVSREAYGQHRRQYVLRICHQDWPANAPRPLAVYYHGGAWTFGTPESFLPAARLFIEAGYEVIMPSYRRLPLNNFLQIHEDLLTIREQFLVGRQLLVMAGMSAGGQLAAFSAWNDDYWNVPGLERPQQLLLCGAVVDFDHMNLATGLRLLVGKPQSELYQLANPAQQFQQARQWPQQQLFVHGTADATANFEQIHCFYASQKEKLGHTTTHWIPGGTHLDSCRWMYQDDDVAEAIRRFLFGGARSSL